MPVFRSGDTPPEWCELKWFEIVTLAPGEFREYTRAGSRERIVVCSGECRIVAGEALIDACEGTVVDVDELPMFDVRCVKQGVSLVRMQGQWGDTLGGAGVFYAEHAEVPENAGDPTAYERHTRFDNHFHDCDEYWIVVSGDCEAVSEGKHYRLQPGDCLATGMGHHHDMARVFAPVTAVYFETTLEGRKRLGHLWEHTHGRAEPKLERM